MPAAPGLAFPSLPAHMIPTRDNLPEDLHEILPEHLQALGGHSLGSLMPNMVKSLSDSGLLTGKSTYPRNHQLLGPGKSATHSPSIALIRRNALTLSLLVLPCLFVNEVCSLRYLKKS